jgi:hypothetical protein
VEHSATGVTERVYRHQLFRGPQGIIALSEALNRSVHSTP